MYHFEGEKTCNELEDEKKSENFNNDLKSFISVIYSEKESGLPKTILTDLYQR